MRRTVCRYFFTTTSRRLSRPGAPVAAGHLADDTNAAGSPPADSITAGARTHARPSWLPQHGTVETPAGGRVIACDPVEFHLRGCRSCGDNDHILERWSGAVAQPNRSRGSPRICVWRIVSPRDFPAGGDGLLRLIVYSEDNGRMSEDTFDLAVGQGAVSPQAGICSGRVGGSSR